MRMSGRRKLLFGHRWAKSFVLVIGQDNRPLLPDVSLHWKACIFVVVSFTFSARTVDAPLIFLVYASCRNALVESNYCHVLHDASCKTAMAGPFYSLT